MANHVTTAHDFAVFKEEFEKWVDIFGLRGWEIGIEHADEGDKEDRAWINYCAGGRTARVMLGKTWFNYDDVPPAREFRRCAFHEACELLFASLNDKAKNRFVTPDEIYEEKHNIIRILENVFWHKWDKEGKGDEGA